MVDFAAGMCYTGDMNVGKTQETTDDLITANEAAEIIGVKAKRVWKLLGKDVPAGPLREVNIGPHRYTYRADAEERARLKRAGLIRHGRPRKGR